MADARPAPYPAETRAKGWRFELDLERIEQSDTWALAAPDVRPWLFLLWAKAWQQVPCGSLPGDHALIAARLGMTQKAFEKARVVLLRGWWVADDGRLYHDVIADRVRSMLDAKRKESDRKAAYRAKMDAERNVSSTSVPPMSHGTTTGQTQPSTVGDDTGTSTGTGTRRREEKKEKGALLCVAPSVLADSGFTAEVAAEFIAHKSRHKAPLTARAWADHITESAKAGWTPQQAAEKVMAKGWKGFEAKYVADEKPAHRVVSFRERDAAIAAARVHEMTGGLVSAKPPGHRADALQEVFDATPRLVG